MHWQRYLALSIVFHIILIAIILSIPYKRTDIIETIVVDFTIANADLGINKRWGWGGNGVGEQKGSKGVRGPDKQYVYNHNTPQVKGKHHNNSQIEAIQGTTDVLSLNPLKGEKVAEHGEVEPTGIRAINAGYGTPDYGTGRYAGDLGGLGHGAGIGGGGPGGGISLADYTYVRDAVMKNIFYPEKARRMGIEGRVIISFVINESGFIDDVKILKSSGYAVLDDAVKDAIYKVNQFRKKHERLVVQLPVEFKLK